MLLWIGLFTDYSWNNVWANIGFAPTVGLVGLVTWLYTGKNSHGVTPEEWLKIRKWTCFPAMIGGLPYIVLTIILFFPPFTLGTLFWIDEQRSAIQIQQEVSPDGSRVAEVYLLPVGSYSGGNGRIEVHLKYRWLPFIKRDIYYRRVSQAKETSTEYLRWRDNDTLYIQEGDNELQLGFVKFDLPAILLIPLNFLRLLNL